MRHLQLHHIITGGYIKTRHGYVNPHEQKKHHKSHLSSLMGGLKFGSGTPAVKKTIEEYGSGLTTRKRITPLRYKF